MSSSKTTRPALALLIVIAVWISGCQPTAQQTPAVDTGKEPTTLTGAWVGQHPPGMQPELFAPGFVSTGLAERDAAMTPEGNEFYFTGVVGGNFTFSAILVTTQVGGEWTQPEVAPFSGQYMDLEPAISPDGQRFFFMSTRPRSGSEELLGDEDIWVMDRFGDGWGEPYNLGPPVNSDQPEFFPSVTNDGTIYFTRRGEDGMEAIFRSRQVDGKYSEPERLGAQVNSSKTHFNAYISPDESFLIVCVWGREDSLGSADYYIVFRSPDDIWSEPVNLGDTINSAGGGEWSPYVSPDGKYFFFMSSRARIQDRFSPVPLTYADMQQMHTQPENGNSDIWWVDVAVLHELRPEGF